MQTYQQEREMIEQQNFSLEMFELVMENASNILS
jgi:hypothetical protein